jgi:hypothetical protein
VPASVQRREEALHALTALDDLILQSGGIGNVHILQSYVLALAPHEPAPLAVLHEIGRHRKQIGRVVGHGRAPVPRCDAGGDILQDVLDIGVVAHPVGDRAPQARRQDAKRLEERIALRGGRDHSESAGRFASAREWRRVLG